MSFSSYSSYNKNRNCCKGPQGTQGTQGTQGATGTTGTQGATGTQGISGLNLMIPYEPWNQDIVSTIEATAIQSTTDIYYIQFRPPTTGIYNIVYMLTGPDDNWDSSNRNFIGAAIYTDFDNAGALITGAPSHGIPRSLIAHGAISFTTFTANKFYTIKLIDATSLNKDTLYWFAFSVDSNDLNSIQGPHNHFPVHNAYDPSNNSVLVSTGVSSTQLNVANTEMIWPDTITPSTLAAYKTAVWFRLTS